MPAKGSDDLFRLIKSLTPAEKRYFKTFASRHTIGEKNNYLELFDFIDGMEKYDEKKLAGKKYVSQLPRQKNYLQIQVLKSLQHFYADDSVQFEIENNIQQIRILQKKRLYDVSARLIERTKGLCEKHQLFVDQEKVLRLERALMGQDGRIYQEKYFTPVNNAMIRQLEYEKNHIDYFHLQNLIIAKLYANDYPKDKNGKPAAQLLLDHPLLKDEKLATTIYSKCIFHNIFLTYYRFVFNYAPSYFHAKKYIALKKEEYGKTANTVEYTGGLHNYFVACLNYKKFNACEVALKELELLPAKNLAEEGIVFGTFMNLKAELFISTLKYAEGAAFAETIKSRFEKIAPFINSFTRIASVYYCFQLSFLSGNLKKALYWMQRLLEEDLKTQRPEVFMHAQVQNILLHYQLNNFEQIPYLSKSVQRFMEKHNPGAFEKIMLDFFNQCTRNGINQRHLLSETKEKLDRAFADKAYEEKILHYFNYPLWFEMRNKKRVV